MDIPEESVLGNLSTFDWSQENSVAFEVALDSLGRIVARYAALLAAERRKPNPDRAAIDAWRAGQMAESARQHALRLGDPDLQQVIEQAAARLRDLPVPERKS
jgi:hypothetical protein